jgi:hypothetical protein
VRPRAKRIGRLCRLADHQGQFGVLLAQFLETLVLG